MVISNLVGVAVWMTPLPQSRRSAVEMAKSQGSSKLEKTSIDVGITQILDYSPIAKGIGIRDTKKGPLTLKMTLGSG